MRIIYDTAIEALISEFPSLQKIYSENQDEYIGLPYALYESEFQPYVMYQVRQRDMAGVKRCFDFIEKLFVEGDDEVATLVGVSFVESTFFEEDYEKHKDIILGACGKHTRRSFELCVH